VASIWSLNDGVLLGYPAHTTEGPPPPLSNPIRYKHDRHIVTIGPNGSGKTKRLLVPALHDLTDWSCVVVDIKGELCAMTAAHRQKASRNAVIIRLNPFNVLGLGSDGFNPIAALQLNDDFPDDALELAESVIRISGNEPHWSQAAQELVAALIMYVRLVIPNGSFADVRALLGRDDAGIRNLVRGGKNLDPRQLDLFERDPEVYVENNPDYRAPVKHNGQLHPGMIEASEIHGWPEIETKAARFGTINAVDREMHSVLSTALTQTRWLDSRPVKRDLAKNPIDFSMMKNRPVTIYLILPARRLGTHSAWLRLMIASVVQKLMKDTRPAKAPVLLMLDEYYAIAEGDGFPVIARNMAMFRGYGIKLWTVWQDLAQAERLYQKGFESFLGNAGVVQSFAPQDVVTAEYLSQRVGQTMRQLVATSESRQPNPSMPLGMSVSYSSNTSLIQLPLMLPQDIRDMETGFSLVISHVEKGAVRCYVPWPGDVSRYRHVMNLDPANAA
jgi:type IV secretion system protein VirD4